MLLLRIRKLGFIDPSPNASSVFLSSSLYLALIPFAAARAYLPLTLISKVSPRGLASDLAPEERTN